MAVRLGCTCSSSSFSVTDRPKSPEELNRHGTGGCVEHSDPCELYFDTCEPGFKDNELAVETSKSKVCLSSHALLLRSN